MTVSAPWSLRGDGYMLFYKFSREFIEEMGFVPPELSGKFDGFLGNLMLVNYHSSPVGPYRELLFMPGKFRVAGSRWYSITKIYVNSSASTENGRNNWGIPKETVDFRRNLVSKNFLGGDTERIELLKPNGEPFFSITLSAGGLKFPVSTALIPIRLIQYLAGKTFFTSPKGTGKGQLATIKNIEIDSRYFPDISQSTPIAAVKVTDFVMEFPESTFTP